MSNYNYEGTVTRDNNTLYHVQNLNVCSDGTPYDLFLWCDHAPTKDDLRLVAREDFDGLDNADTIIEEICDSSEVYAVYAEGVFNTKENE